MLNINISLVRALYAFQIDFLAKGVKFPQTDFPVNWSGSIEINSYIILIDNVKI